VGAQGLGEGVSVCVEVVFIVCFQVLVSTIVLFSGIGWGYAPTSNPSSCAVPKRLNPASTLPGGLKRFYNVVTKVLADDGEGNEMTCCSSHIQQHLLAIFRLTSCDVGSELWAG
jgi:hypothetical protein